MSEQREAYMPWSETLGEYGQENRDDHDSIDTICAMKNRGRGCFGATDWRPVRIPPPAEIAANARDAATLRWIDDWLEDRQREEDYESFTSDFIDDLRDQIERTTRQYAAMKGGE